MEQTSLFERSVYQPLAARLRPAALDEVVGQQHLIGPARCCAASSSRTPFPP